MSAIILTRTKGAGFSLPGFRNVPVRSSCGSSDEAEKIEKFLSKIESSHDFLGLTVSPKRLMPPISEMKSLAEKLFDAVSDVKVMTSQVAMHLDHDWRAMLFKQLDLLLDVEGWHEDDKPLQAGSYATFLRMVLAYGPMRRPGLGVSDDGNLIGAWTNGSDRLTLEFLPGDVIRWVLSCEIDGELEHAAGDNPVGRMQEVLHPYKPIRWFSDADSIPAAG